MDVFENKYFILIIIGIMVLVVGFSLYYVISGGNYCDLFRYSTLKDVPAYCLAEFIKK